MNQGKKRIFVAGHKGMVGSHIVDGLMNDGNFDVIVKSRAELNLADVSAVSEFLRSAKPDCVIDAAAKVGGIYANMTFRAEFIYENLQMQNAIIWGSHLANVPQLIFLGSSCIYPRLAPQPMSEESLLSGPLEYTNRPYALAKIAGLEMVSSLRSQYGRQYFSVMPTNLYGPRDNFHLQNSHVLPALIRRFIEARDQNRAEVVIWGSGQQLREFLFVEDCADAIIHLMNLPNQTLFPDRLGFGPEKWSHINVGTGQDVSILELAHTIAEATEFKGQILFDRSKPEGTPRKLLDVNLIQSLGWKPKIKLKDGIARTVKWFEDARKSQSPLLRL